MSVAKRRRGWPAWAAASLMAREQEYRYPNICVP